MAPEVLRCLRDRVGSSLSRGAHSHKQPSGEETEERTQHWESAYAFLPFSMTADDTLGKGGLRVLTTSLLTRRPILSNVWSIKSLRVATAVQTNSLACRRVPISSFPRFPRFTNAHANALCACTTANVQGAYEHPCVQCGSMLVILVMLIPVAHCQYSPPSLRKQAV